MSASFAAVQISAEAWLERLAQLATRNGLLLSTVRERDARDFELLLASATLFLPAGQLLDERGANGCLRQFLDTAGAMLDTDHVELRRWLADLGFVHRTDRGTDYRRGPKRCGPRAVHATATVPHARPPGCCAARRPARPATQRPPARSR
jgi:hypothetical protein